MMRMRPDLPLFLAACVFSIALHAADSPGPAYLLVIDHSGSMSHRAGVTGHNEDERTRWTVMQEKACEFVENADVGALVWLCFFSGKIESITEYRVADDKDRARIKKFIQGYSPPAGETALYDAQGKSLEQAERLLKQGAASYAIVKIFTDIKEGEKDKSSTWNEASVAKKAAEINEQTRRLVFMVNRFGNKGEPPQPPSIVPVNVAPAQIKLKSPRQNVKQTAAVQLTLPQRWVEALSARFPAEALNATLDFEPQGNAPISLQKKSWPCSLAAGKAELNFDVANAEQLKDDQAYSGRLVIRYPKLKDVEFLGRTEIPVSFEKNAKIELAEADVRPRDGETFVTNKPILFDVATVKDAKIVWDFGDGERGTGEQLWHTYHAPGDYTVIVNVDAGAQGKVTKKLTLHLVTIEVAVNPLQGPVFAGAPTTLSCTGRGQIERYTWIVDGDEQIGEGKGDKIARVFEQPGRHQVSVIAYAAKCSLQSKEIAFEVFAKPTLGILQPQNESVQQFGSKVKFIAQVEGPVEQVEWKIVPKGSDQPLIAPVLTLVAKDKQQAEFEHAFAEAANLSEVTITATAQLPKDLGIAAPSASVTLGLKAAERSIKITEPPEGRPLFFRESVRFQAEVDAPDVEQVAWQITAAGKELAAKEVSVKTAGGKRVAELEHTFEEAGNALECTVVATAKLPAQIKTPPPSAKISRTVGFKELNGALKIVTAPAFNQPIEFRVECPADEAAEVTWDFGDGSAGTQGMTAVHTYSKSGGKYIVTAALKAKGGRTRTLREEVNITVNAPKAIPTFDEARKYEAGSTVELKHASTDYLKAEWLLDGKPIAENEVSTVLETPGRKTLTLKVIGAIGADGKPMTDSRDVVLKVFPKPDHILFALGVIGALALLVTVIHYCTRNGPAAWVLKYGAHEGRLSEKKVARYWSRWSKKAFIPMNELFAIPEWNTGHRKNEGLTISESGAGVAFSCRDPMLIDREPIPERTSSVQYAVKYTDKRDGLEEKDQSFVIEVEKLPRNSIAGVMLILLVLSAASAAVWWLWQHVYRPEI